MGVCTGNMTTSGYTNKLPCCIKLEFHIITFTIFIYIKVQAVYQTFSVSFFDLWHGNIRAAHTTYVAALKPPHIHKLVAENHTLQLNI